MESIPFYVSATFILTTFLAAIFLLHAIKSGAADSFSGKAAMVFVPFWMIFQMVLASGGFFSGEGLGFPRLPLVGVLPCVVFLLAVAVWKRDRFTDRLPLRTLTLLHIVRVPVEIVLWWLYLNKAVPQLMTFEGRNPDILAGVTAPLIALIAFRRGKENRWLLIAWNLICLVLLLNIVTNAVLSIESPIQMFAFTQPNRAVLYFPYVWLPTIVVPIVLFAHVASLLQLWKNRNLKH